MSLAQIPLLTSKLTLHFNYASVYKSHFSVKDVISEHPLPLSHQPTSRHCPDMAALCVCAPGRKAWPQEGIKGGEEGRSNYV